MAIGQGTVHFHASGSKIILMSRYQLLCYITMNGGKGGLGKKSTFASLRLVVGKHSA